MDIFGVGGPELILLLLLGGLVLGPRRIIELAHDAGKFIRQFQKVARELEHELRREIDQIERSELQPALSEDIPQAGENQPQVVNEPSPSQLPGVYLRFQQDHPHDGDLEEGLNGSPDGDHGEKS